VTKLRGSSLDRVVKVGVFLRDAAMFAEMNAVFSEVFGSALPARTAVPGLQFREGVDVEIDVIAAI
jgi:2-iminobutanoate/2-iminopropanoate deaminase